MLRSENNFRKHALVIGGSLAGLFAARVLSNHFEHVTILERDPVHDRPEPRKGQPQARQGHGLLAQGFQIIKELFPGIDKTLINEGAIVDDMGEAIRWYQFGGYRKQFNSHLIGIVTDRLRLEWQIRRRVLELQNVTFISSCAVKQLILSPDGERISGVEVMRRTLEDQIKSILADLIVDATGRGSRTPTWLETLGYAPPEEDIVKVDLGYASRTYRRRSDDLHGAKLVFTFPTPRHAKRMGFMLPIEGERWMVTAGGWCGDHPPTDEKGFHEFIRSLPAPDISNVIDNAEPLSDVIGHKFPGSLRRRYEKLKRFPEGFLVIGDAVASFTPVYAQGMTSAAMQARVLDKVLQTGQTQNGLWRSYFKQVADVTAIPWQLAVGEDFRFLETEGKKPLGMDIINSYVSKVHKATHHDTVIYGQFLRVMNLLDPPTSLMHPRIIWRVLKSK